MNGVLIVDKPSGITSSKACLTVKRLLGLKKAGHLGTLDPMATGVLPLCVNEGTKLVQFLMQNDKEYIATMHLGIETDTQDSQGTVLHQVDTLPMDSRQIEKAFREFTGEQLQTPPMYSALKRDGVPLYKIARQGGWVPREKRRICIKEIDVLEIDVPRVRFRVACTHGTYIRTLCHDVGRRLGCGAHLTSLQRVRNGIFHIDEAVTLDDCKDAGKEALAQKHLISSKDALNGMPEITVSDDLERKIRNGVQPVVADLVPTGIEHVRKGGRFKCISSQGGLIAVVELLMDADLFTTENKQQKACKVLRVFLD